MCSIDPEITAMRGVQYFKEGKEIATELQENTAKYFIFASDKESSGNYYCAIWVELPHNQKIMLQSDRLAVRVTDPLPAPYISYTSTRDGITVTCSVASSKTVTRKFQYLQNGKEMHIINLNGNVATYMIYQSAKEAAGIYSCRYWEEKHGRQISSLISNSVDITLLGSTSVDLVLQTSIKKPFMFTSSPPLTSQGSTTVDFVSQTSIRKQLKFTSSPPLTSQGSVEPWIYYFIGGCLFFGLMSIILFFLLRAYRRHNHPQTTLTTTDNMDLQNTMIVPYPPAIPLLVREEMENQPVYEEIDQLQPPVKNTTSTPKPSISNDFSNSGQTIYSKAQSPPRLPPVYYAMFPKPAQT
ncbi:uncharacterized protein LOC128505142 [Spea bombifrons]|uniref:uncharacterized protein LOC128505142 n=1 Tax=Spea bombifrons TaxID=233779 RepID=UPI00234AC0E7|nr:uncharacterized protein LOC128505142 [Spea bombifrons]